MNRRSFLSALAATSLTPILPPQVFASGGIVNPEHCGFVAFSTYGEMLQSKPVAGTVAVVASGAEWWAKKTQADIVADIQAFLAMPDPAPSDRIIMPKDRYTRYLRA